MTDYETTTEQLAEIEGQAADTPATEYTPPDGWRVLAVGEKLQPGDMIVRSDGYCYSTERVGYYVGLNQRHIRRIGPEPQPEPVPKPEPQPQPVEVREGQWRTRRGEVKNIRPCKPLQGAHFVWPWTDGIMTFQDNGRHQGSQESAHDLVEYLGPIEEQPEPQPQPEPEPEPEKSITPDNVAGQALAGVWNQAKAERTIEELRSEVYYVHNLLGESRQRVRQLEELVSSLRIINETQEKAFTAEGRENTALRNQLAAVKAELVTQAETSRRLQIELDAAQQVPQAVNDRFEEGWDSGTARAVETIAEWTEPFRRCGSERLAWMVMANLPHIMRTLTGLTPED